MTAPNKSAADANEFSGKHVLVTGGTKGAGKAIADRFREAHSHVTVDPPPAGKSRQRFIQRMFDFEGTTKVIREILSRSRV
jgi:NAD(P)-dependent dehydrogenase (short-subunit alcohol dehydrogenase family)